jgi:DinB superfamily
MTFAGDGWVDALADGAPDVVAAWRGIDAEEFLSVRREVRRRAGEGSSDRIVSQLAATALALADVIAAMPPELFSAPGGEGDWNVAEATGHVADARAGLCLAAAKAASGAWPTHARAVVPGIPGLPVADRDRLIRRIAQSQRIVERCATSVRGRELDACPLDHPLVGRLRCGEWLLFAGVHDVMHLEQLHAIADAV